MDKKKDPEEDLEKKDPKESDLFKDEEVKEDDSDEEGEDDFEEEEELEEEKDSDDAPGEEETKQDANDPFEDEDKRIDEDPDEEEPVRRPTFEKTHPHESAAAEFGPIKRPRTFNLNPERETSSYSIGQPLNRKSGSSKKTFFLIIILLLVLLGGGFLILKSRGMLGNLMGTPKPTPTPTETPEPTPTPNPLNKEEWRFEVLNGSGETGLAKKVADKIKEQGYIVTKTGNADKTSYEKTQLFALKDLEGKVDLVVADLKDIIKIASFGGELTPAKDSTASARIILGKDSI